MLSSRHCVKWGIHMKEFEHCTQPVVELDSQNLLGFSQVAETERQSLADMCRLLSKRGGEVPPIPAPSK